jgi:hypothetical protein
MVCAPFSLIDFLDLGNDLPQLHRSKGSTMAGTDIEAAPPATADLDSGIETESTALATTSNEVAAPAERKVKKIIRKKRRPARVQIDPSTVKSEPPPQTGTIFNIWYNKWSGGDREDKYLSKTAAAGRCNIALDSGYTLADKINGSYFCLRFARGICSNGQECEYLHRLPGIHDIFNPNVDVFGRDKHSDYRDDMGGVGSFLRQNRTIYVGRIHVSDDIEEIVARHFAEWGQVERSEYLPQSHVEDYTNLIQFVFSILEVLGSSHIQTNQMLSLQRKQWHISHLIILRFSMSDGPLLIQTQWLKHVRHARLKSRQQKR